MKITKKLKDITYKELTNYCKGKIICPECFLRNVRCATSNACWVYHKDMYSDKFLDQTIEVEVPDILDKEEKEYLTAVIKPFRNNVLGIAKKICGFDKNVAYIAIKVKPIKQIQLEYKNILLPYFKINKMYNGMELDKMYTLEELGL